MACISSLKGVAGRVGYVDSGSTDGPVSMAHNDGFRRLRKLAPALAYVHFVDGDCDFVEGWIGKVSVCPGARRDVAVLCGRWRERYSGRSNYGAGLDTLELKDFEQLCKLDPDLEYLPICFQRVIEQVEADV